MIAKVLFFFLTLLLVQVNAAEKDWASVGTSENLSGRAVSGRVVPQDGALNIESARVTGRVLSLLRREGEHVSEGTTLYAVSSSECYSLQEERRVANAKNITDLIEGVKKREHQLGLKLDGENCLVIASHEGILIKRNLESGAAFVIGDVLGSILNTKRLTVELDIPEKSQSIVHTGQKVTLHFASNPGQEFKGAIQDVVPTIDPTTRTSKARVTGVSLPAAIGLEALVTAEVYTGGSEKTLTVPTTALVFYRNKRFVIAGDEKTPRPVQIEILSENESLATIRPNSEKALKTGDMVLTKGALFLVRKLLTENLP